ncbi:hypothetical protein [Pseudomonas oryzihabitans]|uniref:hypothetical protein n=1 Tax=Pseudomonas oryzihabitans TaxID=47885 RepID=UPI00214E3CE2|nr:hypothetical protein [Pseudomonas psychrotolerans]UUW70533.1 hypothetical protein NRG74_15695 [Pseudomonas psychrotolerans]
MQGIDYWRLNDELTIIQAALLIVGVDPSSEEGANCEDWKPEEQPPGYQAAKHALMNALRKEKIAGDLEPYCEYDINGNIVGDQPGTLDPAYSRIEVESLKQWLKARGITGGFFFPDSVMAAEYLDARHPRYSAKLAAAVKVWQAMEDENLLSGKSAAKAMKDWMQSHYRELGLVWNGEINNTGIEEVAKVANWQTTGGSPRTPG